MFKVEYGKYDYDEELGGDGLVGDVRNGFIRKVLGILSIQLIVTAIITTLFVAIKSFEMWVIQNIWFYYLMMVISLILVCALFCLPTARNSYPLNLILLGAFTLAEGVLIGVISATYDTRSILIALSITIVVTIGLSIFAIQTKIDFTLCSGFLFACVMVLIVMSMILVLFRTEVLTTICASLGALVFCMYLVYDVQLIAGGKRFELGPDDYIIGAIALYIDIITLFLYILQLVGSGSRS